MPTLISKRIENMDNDELLKTVELIKQHGSYRKTSQATGIPRTELEARMLCASRRGLNGLTQTPLPEFEITQVTTDGDGNPTSVQSKPAPLEPFKLHDGLEIYGISSFLDAEGRVTRQWIKTRQGKIEVDWSTVFSQAFKDYEGRAVPTASPGHLKEDLLTLIPCNDWHINMMGWEREVGENWDVKIAERTIGAAINEVILRSPPAKTAVVLGGGDLMHNDDNTNRTAKSHNVLDCDGRFQKGLEAAQRLKVHTIDAALNRHENVIVRVLQGNHDEYSSVAIGHFLAAWYRNEPRVVVDLDASLFWWYRFGSVLLGATHGHTVKLSQMPQIMAHRRAPDWGATKFRYIHGFHIHHKEVLATEGQGVVCEAHQAPIPQDAWHWGSGFLSNRSMQTITYHRDYGETGRVREAILDA
jgi:hypothetical protein